MMTGSVGGGCYLKYPEVNKFVGMLAAMAHRMDYS